VSWSDPTETQPVPVTNPTEDRPRPWKRELVEVATQTGLAITVRHFPPGTFTWSKVENRPFSLISMNWRGRPLTSYEVFVNLVAGTATRTGLKVTELDETIYPRGIKITDAKCQIWKPGI
jgi:hypothetical protein